MRLCLGAVLSGLALASAGPAEAASCRGHPPSVMTAIKGRVEAVRLLEREGADRLVGLDTRTFVFLAAEVRKAADQIAGPLDLAEEEDLRRCRNQVQPVRSLCRGAALALAVVFDEGEGGQTQGDSRRTYAQAMPQCERSLKLPPLSTTIRITN